MRQVLFKAHGVICKISIWLTDGRPNPEGTQA